jgi:hypothetical protein
VFRRCCLRGGLGWLVQGGCGEDGGSLFARDPSRCDWSLGREGSRAVLPPVSIVWPCLLSVDAYVLAGREIEFPRPDCPSCLTPMGLWSGYRRHVREGGRCQPVFIPRVRCRSCQVTHAMLPAFLLVGRLDVAETVGAVVGEVAAGWVGVRPMAEQVAVPYTTARGWCRRFAARASRVAMAFAALAVELGGRALAPARDRRAWALAAMAEAWRVAAGLPGWLALGVWRFVSAVCGGRLIAANTDSPWLIIGRRRFMPPVP